MDRLTHNNVEQLESGLPDEKIITLKSVYKQGALTLMPVRDTATNWYKGVPRLSDDEKRKLSFWADEKSKVKIIDGFEFDLNDPVQRGTWEWVKHSPKIATSYEEAQSSPHAIFYVYIQGVEAAKKVTTYENRFKAMEYVMGDASTNYASRARITGLSMEGEPIGVIKEYLLSKCETDPKLILDAYENTSLSIKLLLFRGLDKGIIQRDVNDVFTYKTSILGVGESSAIAFLQEPGNATLAEGLSMDINPEYFEKGKTPAKARAKRKI